MSPSSDQPQETTLPPIEPINPSLVTFTIATPHQRILSWRLNGASWASPLTLDQYVGREQTLSETELSANGGTLYYILHHRDDPELIISACEVTSKRLVIAGPGTNGSKVGNGYAIASVFTNPRFRNQGMASYLLKRVQEEVDKRGDECGVLYSDIGRVFYKRLGWKDFRTPQLLAGIEGDATAFPVPEGVELLNEDQVRKLCEDDVKAVEEEFSRLAAAPDGKTHIVFLPTPAQFSWHFARDGYVCPILRNREVQWRGARTEDRLAWIAWDHDLREKKLKILRIVSRHSAEEKKKAVKRLLLAAMAEARDWDVPKVLVWEPSEEVSVAATEIWRELGPKVSLVFEEREDGSIPSLRWQNGENMEVVWHHNEYYGWC